MSDITKLGKSWRFPATLLDMLEKKFEACPLTEDEARNLLLSISSAISDKVEEIMDDLQGEMGIRGIQSQLNFIAEHDRKVINEIDEEIGEFIERRVIR